MGARVVSLRDWVAPKRDWSQRELAEFYRVESALLQAGLRLESDRGLTDEGDPWFCFCRQDDGEVFVHFARLGAEYILVGPAFPEPARGRDFASLVEDLISRHPLVQTRPKGRTNVFMHPAALLIAVVGTAFFKTSEARADDGGDSKPQSKRQLAGSASPLILGEGRALAVDAQQTLAVVASAISIMATDRSYLSGAPVRAALPQMVELPRAAPTGAELGTSFSKLGVTAPPSGPQPSTQALSTLVSTAEARDVGGLLALSGLLADLATAATRVDRAPVEGDLPAAAGPVAPVFLIEVAAGPLPGVAAVRFLEKVLGRADFEGQVVKLEKLPEFLGDLISRGVHVVVPAPGPDAPPLIVDPVDAVPTWPLETPPQDTAGAPSTAGPQAGDGSPGPISHAPDSAAPPPVTQAPAPPAPGSVTYLNDVQEDILEQAISQFVSHTPHATTIVTGDDVVMYDARLLESAALLMNAKSITFNFADGSSISLIGLPTALGDIFHLPHAG